VPGLDGLRGLYDGEVGDQVRLRRDDAAAGHDDRKTRGHDALQLHTDLEGHPVVPPTW